MQLKGKSCKTEKFKDKESGVGKSEVIKGE